MKTKLLTFATLALLASSAFAATPTYLYRLYSPGVKGATTAGPILPTVGSVFATWNPSDKAQYIALSNSNLTSAGYGTCCNGGSARATQGKSSGKWYWEITQDGSSYNEMIGIGNGSFALGGYQAIGSSANSWSHYGATTSSYYRYVWSNVVASSYVTASPTQGMVLMFALDMDNHAFYFGQNGVWFNSADPTSGAAATGATISGSGMTGAVFPAIGNYSTTDVTTANFGATPFKYAVPAGYHAGVFQ